MVNAGRGDGAEGGRNSWHVFGPKDADGRDGMPDVMHIRYMEFGYLWGWVPGALICAGVLVDNIS